MGCCFGYATGSRRRRSLLDSATSTENPYGPAEGGLRGTSASDEIRQPASDGSGSAQSPNAGDDHRPRDTIRVAMDEAPLEETPEGLAPTGEGWFVVNARAARWRDRPGRGFSLALTGSTDHEAETFFPMLGVNLAVLSP